MNKIILIALVFILLSCSKSNVISENGLQKQDMNLQWLYSQTGSENIYPVEKEDFILSVDLSNKKFSTKTDCNRFFGDLNVEGKKVNFANVGSTRMNCKDSQEKIFIDQLIASKEYVKENDSIIVYNDNVKMYFKLLS